MFIPRAAKLLPRMVVALLALEILDWLTTIVMLRHGAVELNLVVRPLLVSAWALPLLAIKLTVAGAWAASMRHIGRRWQNGARYACYLSLIALVVVCAPVVSNLLQIVRHGP